MVPCCIFLTQPVASQRQTIRKSAAQARGPCVLSAGCPSRDLLARIANKWTALIIHCLAARTLRYNELQREVSGISQKMLTQTLRALEEDGLILRKVYPVIPPMVEYTLTPLGRTLVIPLHAICQWAETYLPKIEAHRRNCRQRPSR
jgi:DNA-binding HxlR family transcriptional regulator